MSDRDVAPATDVFDDPDVCLVIDHWWRRQVLDGGAA
jgi:hypothetical protein